MKAHIHRTGAHWTITAELHDVSKTPALMVRIKAVRGETGDLIVPALYDDNYNALMPGEERTLHIELENADTRGGRPYIVLYGFNLSNGAHQQKWRAS